MKSVSHLYSCIVSAHLRRRLLHAHHFALTLGDDKRYLAGFSAASLASLALAGSAVELPTVYYALLLAGGGGHLAWQVSTVELYSRADCLAKFQSNHHFGALLFAALVGAKLLMPGEQAETPASASGDGEAERSTGRPVQPRTFWLLWEALPCRR